MKAGAVTEGRLTAVPLLNAVFCANCETVSNSPHDACTVCGSHSLISLYRILGGTVFGQRQQPTEDQAKTARYNLELTANVHDVPGTELSYAMEVVTRLAQAGGDVKRLHINIESVSDAQVVLKAA